jgi:hypothetical protein
MLHLHEVHLNSEAQRQKLPSITLVQRRGYFSLPLIPARDPMISFDLVGSLGKPLNFDPFEFYLEDEKESYPPVPEKGYQENEKTRVMSPSGSIVLADNHKDDVLVV